MTGFRYHINDRHFRRGEFGNTGIACRKAHTDDAFACDAVPGSMHANTRRGSANRFTWREHSAHAPLVSTAACVWARSCDDMCVLAAFDMRTRLWNAYAVTCVLQKCRFRAHGNFWGEKPVI